MSRGMIVGAVLLAPLWMTAPALAQEAEQGPPPEREGGDLIFEREVFVYPSFERRNPFVALDAGAAAVVRFEQLSLMGILYDTDPALSVAVFTTGELTIAADGSGAQRAEGQTWNAKVGQTVGNVRIVEIHPTEVVVEVEEFGLTERKIMQLQTRRLGGTQ